MKKIFLLIILLIIIIFITGIVFYEFVYLNDYTNSVYVVATSDGHTKFYEINDRGGKREVPRFDYDYENIYYPRDCYYSYIDRSIYTYIIVFAIVMSLITLNFWLIWKRFEDRYIDLIRKSFELINLIPEEIKNIIVYKLNEQN